ncbi:hypothetical protein RQM47_12575 [Rubrivirga sp. S365]|uniref:DUF5666 domain-containing protein n=1 Tax=Rubrivirga litoralis TaxID=3075598 RepID=A0ABU3BU19_9BACT|nr:MULTISPECIES: hypothetical protein [unclassified Rubrivirga]MDT0632790.1 hypothetical protein [Rubrivirga sp. F394]MDT7857480.1 hypothetical protein [Rubrivirga sp. S365]
MRLRPALLALSAGLCALAACAPPTGDVLRGEVVSVDAAPLAYDGDALVVVRTDAGERTVHVPARINLCAASDFPDLGTLQPGDRVEARGEENAEGGVTPCTSADHFFRVVAP